MSSDTIKITFDVEPTGAPLTVTALLDNTVVWEKLVDQKHTVEVQCSDDVAERTLVLKLSGKQAEHTEIDANGNIVKDSTIKFSNFVVDDIEITQTVLDTSKYHHNFNGNGSDTVENFYGEIGCNGNVVFNFTTPFYIWLLENM